MEATEAKQETEERSARSILRMALQDLHYQLKAADADYEFARAFGKPEEDEMHDRQMKLLQAIEGTARVLREVE